MGRFINDDNAAVLEHTRSLQSEPCIPYVSIYMDKIAKLPGRDEDIKGRKVNFQLRRGVFHVIAEFQKYQSRSFNFISVHQINILLKEVYEFGQDTKGSSRHMQERGLLRTAQGHDES
eukprot:GFYU01019998.1.p1 GENE.GFYU01019998.1~~GFYU01019998.1.p1  ORF type:complete len:118 (-),score=30.23 GFYU01019998.1:61-414(-)